MGGGSCLRIGSEGESQVRNATSHGMDSIVRFKGQGRRNEGAGSGDKAEANNDGDVKAAK